MDEHSVSFLGADPLATADTLEALGADVRKVAAGDLPDPTVLAGFPLLHGWGIARKPVTCLTGKVYGHPALGDGRVAITSEVFAIARDQRWVRTMSRFYELGPAGLFGDAHG
jgi:hypothetical protein